MHSSKETNTASNGILINAGCRKCNASKWHPDNCKAPTRGGELPMSRMPRVLRYGVHPLNVPQAKYNVQGYCVIGN